MGQKQYKSEAIHKKEELVKEVQEADQWNGQKMVLTGSGLLVDLKQEEKQAQIIEPSVDAVQVLAKQQAAINGDMPLNAILQLYANQELSQKSGKKGYKWGNRMKCSTKKKAQQVARAAHASGYKKKK